MHRAGGRRSEGDRSARTIRYILIINIIQFLAMVPPKKFSVNMSKHRSPIPPTSPTSLMLVFNRVSWGISLEDIKSKNEFNFQIWHIWLFYYIDMGTPFRIIFHYKSFIFEVISYIQSFIYIRNLNYVSHGRQENLNC